MRSSSKTVMVMAGGTGGHVFPALAAAKQFQEKGYSVIWLGTRAGIESDVVPNAGIEICYLDVAGVRGQGIQRLLFAPLKITRSIISVLNIVKQRKPILVLGMGGFVTGPGGIGAWLSRTPLFIHEQNAIAGFTNKVLSRFASRVFQAFPDTFTGKKVLTTGNPVRKEIYALGDPEQRLINRTGQLQILILGGSQGAVALNEMVPEALGLLSGKFEFSIRHQAGGKNLDKTLALYQTHKVHADVTPFIDDMAEAYAWADLVICRSGALTVCELAAAGVPALLIPYPFAVDDHQTRNGEYLVKHGAAILVQQRELNASLLAEIIEQQLMDRKTLLKMAKNARKAAVFNATEQVVAQSLEAIAHA